MRFMAVLLFYCGVIMAAPAGAAEEKPTLTYLWLYSDSDGESHVVERELTFEPMSDDPAVHALSLHELAGTEGAAILRLERGAFEDWHPAPRRWLLVVLQGASELYTSDGEMRRLTPGMMMLMDDTTGKGHQTRAVGPEDHVALVVPVAELEGVPPAKGD